MASSYACSFYFKKEAGLAAQDINDAAAPAPLQHFSSHDFTLISFFLRARTAKCAWFRDIPSKTTGGIKKGSKAVLSCEMSSSPSSQRIFSMQFQSFYEWIKRLDSLLVYESRIRGETMAVVFFACLLVALLLKANSVRTNDVKTEVFFALTKSAQFTSFVLFMIQYAIAIIFFCQYIPFLFIYVPPF